jgi:hypothetical protein
VSRQDLDYYVLDSLVNDLEAIEDILRMLNSDSALGWRDLHPKPFTRDEIVPGLARLIKEELILAYVLDQSGKALVQLGAKVLPDGIWDDAWFSLTPRGRVVHGNWNPELPT